MNKVTTFASIITLLILTGCAAESDPNYVSPTFYDSYNCKQLKAEKIRLNSKIEQAGKSNQGNQILNTALSAYAISQGSGYFGDDYSELQRLQNQYDVLEQTVIQKECNP